MPKSTWIVPSILSALVLLGVLGWQVQRRGAELAAAQAALEEARKLAEHNAAQAAALKAGLDESKSDATELREKLAAAEKEMEAAAKTKNTLEDEMRAALQSKDITISQLQGKLTVNILDHVLFERIERAARVERARTCATRVETECDEHVIHVGDGHAHLRVVAAHGQADAPLGDRAQLEHEERRSRSRPGRNDNRPYATVGCGLSASRRGVGEGAVEVKQHRFNHVGRRSGN